MLDFHKCQYSESIALGKDGSLDDSQNGAYGYKVFYTVPKEELEKSGLFMELDDVLKGELEFSVDANGNQFGEVLLWTSIEEEDGAVTNDNFVNFNEDITEFVKNFTFSLPCNVWVDVEELYGDKNPKENQLCLGMTANGSLWLYKFSWWDDVCGGFYRMLAEDESAKFWEENLVKIMPLDVILKDAE